MSAALLADDGRRSVPRSPAGASSDQRKQPDARPRQDVADRDRRDREVVLASAGVGERQHGQHPGEHGADADPAGRIGRSPPDEDEQSEAREQGEDPATDEGDGEAAVAAAPSSTRCAVDDARPGSSGQAAGPASGRRTPGRGSATASSVMTMSMPRLTAYRVADAAHAPPLARERRRLDAQHDERGQPDPAPDDGQLGRLGAGGTDGEDREQDSRRDVVMVRSAQDGHETAGRREPEDPPERRRRAELPVGGQPASALP